MNKLFTIFFAVAILHSVLFAQYADGIESLISDDVNIFVKTKKIGDLLKSVNYSLENIFDVSAKGEVISARDFFKEKTGIDYLDASSLKIAGIDINRSMGFIHSGKDVKNEMMMFFIPVLNEKDFPLKFVQILKKMKRGKDNIDLYPVITSYDGYSVYQIGSDIFATAIRGYFVVASHGKMIKTVIQNRDSCDGTLIVSKQYKNYLINAKRNFDVNFYVPGEFIRRMANLSKTEKESEKTKINDFFGKGKNAENNNGLHLELENLAGLMNYVSGGIGLDGNILQVNSSVGLKTENPLVSFLMNSIKTDESKKYLKFDGGDMGIFLSLDYDYLNKSCGKKLPGCEQFNKFKVEFKKETGLDFVKDIIPYYSGVSNVIILDSGVAGGVGDYVTFWPFNNQEKTVKVWNKLRNFAKKKYKVQKKFGEQKIDGRRIYWFIDKKKVRNFVTYDSRGIFAGNNLNMLEKAFKSDLLDVDNKSKMNKVISDQTFLMININKIWFSEFMMKSRKNYVNGKFFDKIGKIFLYCEKKSDLLSVDMDVELLQAN